MKSPRLTLLMALVASPVGALAVRQAIDRRRRAERSAIFARIAEGHERLYGRAPASP